MDGRLPAVTGSPAERGSMIEPFDLAGFNCESCGRPKLNRMLYAYTPLRNAHLGRRGHFPPRSLPTGCEACDEVIQNQHRCTGRPELEAMNDGQEWTCPGCSATWRVRVDVIEERRWEVG